MFHKDTGLTEDPPRPLTSYSKTGKSDEAAAQALFNMVKTHVKLQPQNDSNAREDKVAVVLEEAIANAFSDKTLNLGQHGYTIKKRRGPGATGFTAVRNKAPE